MMKLSSLLLLCVVAAASVTAVDAASPAPARIKERFEASFPGAKVESVHAAPWLGLYEVVTNRDVVYVNEQATLLFSGRIMDIESKEDLTTNRWNVLHPADFGKLPLELAIKTVRGDGSRQLVVFSDPFCPYCQHLEQDLASMDNLTIYTFLHPLEKIHPGATQKAARIWCSADRAAAWSDWMLRHAEPQGSDTCDEQALAKVRELATGLVISSTPTLFFADGHRVGGAISPERMEKEFLAVKTRSAESPHTDAARVSK